MSNGCTSYDATLRVVEPATSWSDVLGSTLSQADMVSDRALVCNPSRAHPDSAEFLLDPCRQGRPALQSRFRVLTKACSSGGLGDRPARFAELARVGGLHGATSHFVQAALPAREENSEPMAPFRMTYAHQFCSPRVGPSASRPAWRKTTHSRSTWTLIPSCRSSRGGLCCPMRGRLSGRPELPVWFMHVTPPELRDSSKPWEFTSTCSRTANFSEMEFESLTECSVRPS